MIAASLLVAGAALVGWALVERVGGLADADPFVRVATAIPLGLTVFGLAGLLLAWSFGMRSWTPWVAVGVPLAALLDPRTCRGRLRSDALGVLRELGRRWVEATVGALFVLALAGLFSGALIQDGGGIATSDHHNLGDLPFHLAIIDGFAYGDNFPPEHPELAGTKLTYPFLVDLVAALLMAGGAGIRDAFVVENAVLVLALLLALRAWAGALTRERLAAWLVPLLFVLNGGLGFLLVVREAYVSERGLLWTALRPPLDATIGASPTHLLGLLRWGNFLTTVLLTQRAFLLGLPLFIVVALLWWNALQARSPAPETHDALNARRMLLAGLIVGLLPLVHAHTLMVAVVLAVAWTPRFRIWERPWRGFFIAAAVLALPQVVWMAYGSQARAASFSAWAPGWESGITQLWQAGTPWWAPIPEASARFAWFWVANTGLVLPLLGAALLWRGRCPLVRRGLGRYLLPFALFFVVPNLFRLAPWMWDNVKFLLFAFLGATPLLALFLARVYRSGGVVGRWAAAALCVTLIGAGTLDVVRVARGAQKQRIFTAEDVEFAALIREHTPPRARILNAPTYNHPLWLTGRRSLLGYPGHVFSHGLDAGAREEEIRRIYRGASDARALLAANAIDFVAVGPQERRQLIVNDDFLDTFPLETRVGEHRLYRVR